MKFNITSPSDIITIETPDFWIKQIEENIDVIRFFNHEIYKYEIQENLRKLIDEKTPIGISRIEGIANMKNGDDYNISDYDYATMVCYSTYSVINVVNRVKFIMELLKTSRENVIKMLSHHINMMHNVDWYMENYWDVSMSIEYFFKNKFGRTK